MKEAIERNYGRAARRVMATVNPIKKVIIKTYCTVHKYINITALEIMRDEGYKKEYSFFIKYTDQINSGVMWADQDFKSTNHFYHYAEEKGLYGFSNALMECKRYYKTAVNYASADNMSLAMFYLGAACHLVQDSTVPQHVNNRLLKSHRKFEMWIRNKLHEGYSFERADNVIRYKSVDEYIKKNALMANRTYIDHADILDKEKRYSVIANAIIVEAEKTTAGLMLDFYYEMIKNEG